MGLLNSPALAEQPECAVGGLPDHVVSRPGDLFGNCGMSDL
jgi:hypothetical protein